MKLLVFDNYDSFTYNLIQLSRKISGCEIKVARNDEIGLDEIHAFDKIILSPGPGLPANAGLLIPLIKEYANSKSMLGVCLGHQAMAEAFGGRLINLENVYHGVAGEVRIEKSSVLFKDFPEKFLAGRYHSWIVSDEGFPNELEVTARDDNGYIMAMQHKKYALQGVQFHPESVLTPMGEQVLKNWLET